MSAIAFDDLGFAYRPGQWVIRGLSGSIAPGIALAALGPNGRGKSTLLRLLLGTLAPQEGTLSVSGRVAFVPQLFDTAFDYAAIDMVLMGRARHVGLFAQPRRSDVDAAHDALAQLGIGDLAPRRFSSLSGGQRQLVILARAIVSGANVLLLDEPTSALDFGNQAHVLDWIRRLSQERGWTIVFTTHNPHHALAASDRVLLMHDVDAFTLGMTGASLTADNLSRLYGHPMMRVSISDQNGAQDVIVPVL